MAACNVPLALQGARSAWLSAAVFLAKLSFLFAAEQTLHQSVTPLDLPSCFQKAVRGLISRHEVHRLAAACCAMGSGTCLNDSRLSWWVTFLQTLHCELNPEVLAGLLKKDVADSFLKHLLHCVRVESRSGSWCAGSYKLLFSRQHPMHMRPLRPR